MLADVSTMILIIIGSLSASNCWLVVNSLFIVDRHIGHMLVECPSTNDQYINQYMGWYFDLGHL